MDFYKKARGTTVTFYGWGGDQRVNAWLDDIVAPQMKERHGVTLRRGDLRRINKHRLDLFRRGSEPAADKSVSGRESSPVGRPDFKSGRGRQTVSGGFDSHSLPPSLSPSPSFMVRHG